ncbi:MAG TPA: TonB-dependent receptor plug domain-containing protein, partial [Cyclobacteriaceae bacterium]|nr:TonB-dependent receptor plug domain-containing protein [Cyclobacteriaceae bacterium]
MRKKIYFMMAIGTLACANKLQAQDSLRTEFLSDVLVSGTRFELPEEKTGKSIFKLNQEDLQRYTGRTVGDVLNEVPGLHIDGNFGAPGTNLSYFMRGGRNRHTLILIDGVPV